MKSIEAWQTTDGKVFSDFDKAEDHQEALQADAFLKIINIALPERYRRQLTDVDWHQVQVNVVTLAKKDKTLLTVLNKMVNTLDFQE